MAYTLLSHTFKVGSGTTPAIDTTGADLIILTLCSVTTPVIVDSAGNTPYVHVITITGGSTLSNYMYYFSSPITNPSHTFTATGTGISFEVTAWSGSLTSSAPVDQTNSSAATVGHTLQPGSITPSQDNELVISAPSSPADNAFTIDSGYTITDQSAPDFSGNQSALAYLIQTSATATNPIWTASDTNPETAIIASFKAAPNGPSAKKKSSMFLVF